MQAKAAIGRVDPESEQTRMLECDIITKLMWMADLDETGVDKEAYYDKLELSLNIKLNNYLMKW